MTGTPETTQHALLRVVGRLEDGADYKSALEGLLLDLDPDDADALMLRIKESRGAWIPLLRGSRGRALFVGDALSGTIPPLAMLGFHVTVVDRDLDRLRFARFRGEEWLPGHTCYLSAGRGTHLPFRDASFDLVVQEGGLPTPAAGWGHDFDELVRVAAAELVLTADNRLGYKRSTGRRGKHHVPRPLEYARAVGRPGRGERTLRGYKRLFRPFAETRSYALYPHAREFSHVVSLDRARPRLTIGPRERRNLLKLGAKAFGLFPVLTPSFAIVGSRAPEGRDLRLDRILAGLAERIGEPRPVADIVVATRSNDCVVHTCPAGSRPDDAPPTSVDPTGRWTLHIPLSPQKRRLVRTHDRFLRRVRDGFPNVPVPEPLFAGEIDGVFLTCERRLAGLTAPNLTGRLAETGAMFADVARDLATLVVEARARFTEERFEELVADRFRLVRGLAAVPSTQGAIDRMLEVARETLVGQEIPLVLYHADLRAKHVQVEPDGRVVGYLDWGASEDVFLPYVDLLHLVAHQRKQEEDCRPAETWALIRGRRGLREHERAPLDDYSRRIGLDEDVRRVLEEIYPVLVAGMAERNWDYSRPRWVHRQYGL